MSWLKWLFTSKYKKLLKYIDAQFSNKGGLFLTTDKNMFYLNFETMEIEHCVEEINNEENN